MDYYQTTRDYFDTLAKPLGSLGELEHLAARLSEAQREFPPKCENPGIVIFAGDHGIVQEESVSKYPMEVTKAMVHTFLKGRAAISVLAKQHGASLEVVNCGVDQLEITKNSLNATFFDAGISKFATENIVKKDAMTMPQCLKAIQAGRDALGRLHRRGSRIAIGGEMGIGNTSAASAIACRLLNLPASEIAGPGAGLGPDALQLKIKAIDQALKRSKANAPEDILASLGGFEIAALVGFYLEAKVLNLPVLVDGFICSTACLIATRMDPSVRRVLIPATLSGEPHHHKIVAALDIGKPILDLQMRLGEASGAALALPLIKSSIGLLDGMATLSSVLNGEL